MNKREIKMLGEIRAHLIYQRHNGMIKFKMDQAIDKIDRLMISNGLPEKLTAENGAKALLIGEFFEKMKIDNPDYCGCGNCDWCKEHSDTPETIFIDVPVSWTTIKSIYDKIVSHYES